MKNINVILISVGESTRWTGSLVEFGSGSLDWLIQNQNYYSTTLPLFPEPWREPGNKSVHWKE